MRRNRRNCPRSCCHYHILNILYCNSPPCRKPCAPLPRRRWSHRLPSGSRPWSRSAVRCNWYRDHCADLNNPSLPHFWTLCRRRSRRRNYRRRSYPRKCRRKFSNIVYCNIPSYRKRFSPSSRSRWRCPAPSEKHPRPEWSTSCSWYPVRFSAAAQPL